MKVVHITTVHAADDIRIFRKECVSLAQAGYEVVLLAPHQQNTCQDGVRIEALPIVRGRVKRMLGVWRAWRAAVRERADVYHFHDPELLPVGLMLKAGGHRVVYDVHENFRKQVLTKQWVHPLLRRALGWCVGLLETAGGRVFDGVITATRSIGENFPKESTVVVQNFPIAEELASIERGPASQDGPVEIAYVGGITRQRGICELVKSMELIPRSMNVRLALAGEIRPSSLEHELREQKGFERVDYHGWCSRAQVAKLLGRARLGLVTFLPAPNHVNAQPNKLFEYMSAGIPVVASHFPLWREIIEGVGSGLLVDPEDPQAIANAIEWLVEHPQEAEAMGRRGQAAVHERFNWEQESASLLAFYQRFRDEDRNRCRSSSSIRQSGDCESSIGRAA